MYTNVGSKSSTCARMSSENEYDRRYLQSWYRTSTEDKPGVFKRPVDIRHPTHRMHSHSQRNSQSLTSWLQSLLAWSVDRNVRQLATYIKDQGKLIVGETCYSHFEQLRYKRNSHWIRSTPKQREGQLIIDRYAYPLLRCSGLEIKEGKIVSTDRWSLLAEHNTTIEFVTRLSGVTIRARAPFRIGTRMGRPEKHPHGKCDHHHMFSFH